MKKISINNFLNLEEFKLIKNHYDSSLFSLEDFKEVMEFLESSNMYYSEDDLIKKLNQEKNNTNK